MAGAEDFGWPNGVPGGVDVHSPEPPFPHVGLWWPLRVEHCGHIYTDAIRGRTAVEAAGNAWWNWPNATAIGLDGEPWAAGPPEPVAEALGGDCPAWAGWPGPLAEDPEGGVS